MTAMGIPANAKQLAASGLRGKAGVPRRHLQGAVGRRRGGGNFKERVWGPSDRRSHRTSDRRSHRTSGGVLPRTSTGKGHHGRTGAKALEDLPGELSCALDGHGYSGTDHPRQAAKPDATLLDEEGQGPAMIHKDCKRLAEVDLPVAEVSRHAAREKSIRHGDPGTLHLLRTDPKTENNRRKE